jgi:hypothetical protein
MSTDAPARAWTADEVVALGVRTDVPTAGAIIAGWGRSESYKAVLRGEFPVPVIKVGRRLIVPVAPILKLLGLAPDARGFTADRNSPAGTQLRSPHLPEYPKGAVWSRPHAMPEGDPPTHRKIAL